MDRSGYRRSVAVLLVGAVVLSLLAAGVLATTYVGDQRDDQTRIPHQLVEPRPQDNVIWPYTSAAKSPEDPKLALNVIVHGDADRLRAHLTTGLDATWNETLPAGANGTNVSRPSRARAHDAAIGWADARGADRYVYVHDYALTERVNETTRRPYRALSFLSVDLNQTLGGQWIPETYQLHDGDYFGARDHLRVFTSPYESDGWVAIQAHSEHWDWFRLRHTVHGIDDAQERLESDLMGRWYVSEVWRMYFQNDGGPNSDGWVTVIDLDDAPDVRAADLGAVGLGLFLAGRLDRRRRATRHRVQTMDRLGGPSRDRTVGGAVVDWLLGTLGRRRFVVGLRLLSYAVLFLALFGLFLLVRAAGIFLERQFQTLSPKLLAGSLYLLIAVGLPLCADRFGRPIPSMQAFVLAATGIAAAMVVDYSLLGIQALPLTIIVHRAGVAVALGLIAAGATPTVRESGRTTRLSGTGLILWIGLLVAPLAGLV